MENTPTTTKENEGTTGGQRLLLIFFLLIAALLIYLIFCLWPHGDSTYSRIFKYGFCLDFDRRLLLLVIMAGGLGSFLHACTSLVDYIGSRKFERSWTAWYCMRPFIGMALALLFYFVIRGGFFPGMDQHGNERLEQKLDSLLEQNAKDGNSNVDSTELADSSITGSNSDSIPTSSAKAKVVTTVKKKEPCDEKEAPCECPRETGGGQVNLFGFLALAGMAGMFSKQATDKLREIFDNLFKTSKPTDRSDPLNENDVKVTLTAITPAEIKEDAAATEFSLKGTAFSDKIKLLVNDAETAFTVVSPDEIKFTYTLTDADKAAAQFTVQLRSGEGDKAVTTDKLTIKITQP